MKNVQDIYPLSPMQQGLLFHTLEASLEGIYCEQSRFTFHGLDVARFQDAWRVVIERHPILRTAFMWEGLDEPLQIVRQQVALPWEEQDWRAIPVAQQPERLEAFLLADRARGFTLGKAPLMRLTLLRLSSDTFHLIWSHHHMLLDGWSIALLLDEVFTAYQAFRQGLPPSLPPAQPFSNYIAWLRKQDMGAARTFWQQRLAGFTAPTPLMVDQLMQAVSHQQEAGCLEYDLRLSRAATAAIQEFARRQQLTLNTVLQGAWALLLSRYSGESDVVFGTTVSTRPVELPGIETMVGLFINTLPCRVQLVPEMELASWLRQIQREQVEARQYDYTPLVQIQQWSEVTRGQPLFKSVLVVESYPQHTSGETEQPGLATEENWYATSQTNYPLAVLIGPGEELLLRAYYQQHFEEETIARLLGHLRVILETMVSVPELRLREIPLLTARERQQLLSEWNMQSGECPGRGVQEQFEEQVKRTPDAIALVYADQHLSYADLNIYANRLAYALRRQGIGPEVVTGICMERSLALVVATLGVLKAGGGYLPLDPRMPEDRLQFILQDIQPPVILTQDHLAHLFPSSRMHVLSLERDWSQIAEESCANPCLVNARTNLAYIISTSGSSGTPKGVQVSHSGLSNLAAAQIAAFQLTPSSRVLQFASWAFDAAVSELVTTLLAGAVLCLASAESIRPGDDLAATLNERAITTVTLPPSALDALPSPEQEAYPYLQTIISAGEPCSGETVGRWLDHCRVINAYGPTEATVCATWQLCEPGWERPPIGKPLTNAEIYVLDPMLQPLPVGVPGELYIGGPGLARGYFKRSDLTAAAFVPHPFVGTLTMNRGGTSASEPGARLYRTGDLVSYLSDGSLLFWGRCDSQIKLRGYRIEPGEIEETLTQHPAIKAAVVMLREDPPHEKRLVAYVVTDQGEALTAELRPYLQKWLPEYMIPSAFVTLRAFPLTSSGKLDRRALPPPGQPVTGTPFVAPRNAVEEAIARTWCEVLDLERVSVHDDFFALGGHSLLATQVISRVQEAFQVKLPVRIIFDGPTIAQLAESILARKRLQIEQRRKGSTAQGSGAQHVTPATSIARVSKENTPFPLSFAQQRLWFLEQFEPGTPLYNIPEAWRFTGDLSMAALRLAFETIVTRHAILRTTFVTIDGEPRQVIAPPAAVAFPLVDLSALPEEACEAAVQQLTTQEGLRPFDLGRDRPLRITLLRLSADDHVLLLVVHHIASDGWSLGVFVRELVALYSAAQAGEPAPLPDLPIQYADFALWQRQWLQGEVLQRQVTYWKEQLADLPRLQLPADHPRPAIYTIRGSWVSQQVPAHLAQQLLALAQQENVSLFMLLLAIFATLFARYTGGDDIPIGTVIANRNRAEIESLIGFFVNTLVMRVDLAGDPTFRELLQRVREVCLDAYANQDLPFEQLVDELQPERDLSITNPLVQVLLVVQNTPGTVLKLPELELQPLVTATATSKFDMTLFLISNEQHTYLEIEYNRDLFEETTMQRLLGHFFMLMEAAITNPKQQLSRLSLLTPDERHRLLHMPSDNAATRTPSSQEQSITQWFERHVDCAPAAIALVCEEGQLTYGALNAHANRLAHLLKENGIGADRLVGIYMERCVELAICILGILKAGAAYLPLDPAYPAGRVGFILEQSQVPIVLTQTKHLATLPSTAARIVCLDTAWELLAGYDVCNLPVSTSSEHLAYVIYTSGSSGEPKGVMVTQGNLLHTTSARLHRYQEPVARYLLVSSFSFDSSVAGFFWTLCQGGSLVMPAEGGQSDPASLLHLIEEQQISHTLAVPSLYMLLLNAPEARALAHLRVAIVAGESCPQALVERHYQLVPHTDLFNEYGPTEGSVWSSVFAFQPSLAGAKVTIGHPIANVAAYLLDSRMEPVPVGVVGEIYLGGAGIARGYLARPDLTAERFVPHPFVGTRFTASEPGARLYRTGDLARYLPDGCIEYVGRNDHQVKLLGYRIELEEIAASLRQHPAISDAVVIAQRRGGEQASPGEKRLVAYVVPRLNQQENASDQADEQVNYWQQVFDTSYQDAEAPQDPTFNIQGWKSSYTGQPIPADEMHEWVDATVARILALQPRRALEIGCGTGLLLLRIAPSCETYWGSDFSPVVLEDLQKLIAAQGLANVELLQKRADEFGELAQERPGYFDTIILNSVVQYFPDIDYLVQVLEDASRLLAPGGSIFIGDVRNLRLLEVFQTSVQLRQAPLSLFTEQLRTLIQRRIAREHELVIDPAFFTALLSHLPQIKEVEVQLKRGRTHNELTRFRYDVVLHSADASGSSQHGPALDWCKEQLTLSALYHLLQEEQPATLHLVHIPNARVLADATALALLTKGQTEHKQDLPERVSALWEQLRHQNMDQGVEPEDFWTLQEHLPYRVSVTWSDAGAPECFDVYLIHQEAQVSADLSASADAFDGSWTSYANEPFREQQSSHLLPELRAYLKQRLPAYMIPHAIVELKALPLLPNGKLDYKALPLPDGGRAALKSEFVAPRTAVEKALAEIWSQVLGCEQVGIHDNFFELGGDSLLTIRVVSKAAQIGYGITVKQLFQHQTVAELAAVVGTVAILAEQGIARGPVPMMPAQRANLEPGMGDPTSHSMAYIVETPEPFDPRLMEQVVDHLLSYHDALRLQSIQAATGWQLALTDLPKRLPLWYVDFSYLPEVEQVSAVMQLATQMVLHFKLAEEPLLRVALCLLGPGRPTPLVVVGHSLVVDMQSWQILIEDLKIAYQQLRDDGKIHFPPKTTGYKQWADRLSEYAQSASAKAELAYWLSDARQHAPVFPLDYPEGRNDGSSLRGSIDMLSREETAQLQRLVSKRDDLHMHDVLLTALLQAFTAWSGQYALLVTVEGYGREPIFDDIDLSHTLGTLALDFPLLLERDATARQEALLHHVHTQLQQVPNKGLGYSALRYMSKDTTIVERLEKLPQPTVYFNYLGSLLVPEIDEFKISGPYNGRAYTMDLTEIQPAPLIITSFIADGQLQVNWIYSINQYRPETIKGLAAKIMEALRAIIMHLLEHYEP